MIPTIFRHSWTTSSISALMRFWNFNPATCMSTAWCAVAALSRITARFKVYSLNTTVLKSRSILEENSKLAVLRCLRHSSPSALNIPSPRKMCIFSLNASPWTSHPHMRKKSWCNQISWITHAAVTIAVLEWEKGTWKKKLIIKV